MPEVNGKKYPYTAKGKALANKAKKLLKTNPLIPIGEAALGMGRAGKGPLLQFPLRAAEQQLRMQEALMEGVAKVDPVVLGPLYRFGKRAGESIAQTVFGPPPPSRNPRWTPNQPFRTWTPQDVSYQGKPDETVAPPMETPKQDMPLPSAPVSRDLDIDQWTERHKYLNKLDDGYPAAPRILGIAPEAAAPKGQGPYGGGGLGRGDPTSFAPPKEELEPAWITRKRDMDRRKVLRQAQRQLKQR